MRSDRPRSSLFGVLVGCSFAVGILATPLPLIGTSTRLSLVLNLAILSIRMTKGRTLKMPRGTAQMAAASVTLFVFYAVALIMFGGVLWQAVSWLFLGLVGITFAILASELSAGAARNFLRTCTAFGALYLTYCCILLYGYDGGLQSWARVRFIFNEAVPTGLNRTLTSGFVFAAVSVAALRSLSHGRWSWDILLPMTTIILFVGLSVLSGSRQATLTFVTFLLTYFAFGARLRTKIVLLTILAAVFIMLSLEPEYWLTLIADKDFSRVAERFTGFLTLGTTTASDDVRYFATQEAIGASLENGGLGIGPGNFLLMRGIAPENSYLELLTDIGIIPATAVVPILALFFFFSLYGGKMRPSSYSAFRACIVILAIIGAQFNELIRDSVFWSLWGVALTFPLIHNTSSTRRGYAKLGPL